ncbi:MAG: response regulator [Paludibacter sp.]|nr:response regulator [Paludibacter sp.]
MKKLSSKPSMRYSMDFETIKILAIDDNNDNLITLKALIRESFPNAETLMAQNGIDGIEMAAVAEPDVILLDIIMPDMDGFDVCKKLKAFRKTADIPVVFLTAIKIDKENRIKALEAGGDGFLSKPVDESELTAQIRAMAKIRKAALKKKDEKQELERLVEERTRELQNTHNATLKLLQFFKQENERRKKSEAALKNSEEQIKLFKQAVDSSSVVITITDVEGKIIYANPYFLKTTGYSYEEILGNNPRILKSGHQPKEFYKDLWDTILSGKVWIGEILNKKKNGELYWVKAVISPILNSKGIITNFVAVKENITQSRQMMEDLMKAKEKAEESDKLKTAFLANMSHEIRTPMNGILGFAELLKEPGLTVEDQQKYIRIIERSGVRMLNIINNIVDISKIEAGLMDVKIQESDINEQIDYIYTFFKPEVEAKGIQLMHKEALSKNNAVILTDREKLFAILTNLVKNAIKYSEKGCIEFGYVASAGTGDEPETLTFYVKDTGIGIRKDKIDIIFDRFRQVSEGSNRNYEGVGLGLSITKAYVEMLGGKIWVESEEGLGSCFYFTLPYRTSSGEVVEKQNKKIFSDKKKGKIANLKILIAEDDETAEWLLSTTLKSLSSSILAAKNGAEAVELCRNHPDIDLIMMDIRLPGMDGYEATRIIRTFNKKVIIFAQTAYGLSCDRNNSIGAGCNEHISKPINKNDLQKLIYKYFTH